MKKYIKEIFFFTLLTGACLLAWFDKDNKFWWVAAILWIIGIAVIWYYLVESIKKRVSSFDLHLERITADVLSALMVGIASGIIFAICFKGSFSLHMLDAPDASSSVFLYILTNVLGLCFLPFLVSLLMGLPVGLMLCKYIGKDTDLFNGISILASTFLCVSHACGIIDLNIILKMIF